MPVYINDCLVLKKSRGHNRVSSLLFTVIDLAWPNKISTNIKIDITKHQRIKMKLCTIAIFGCNDDLLLLDPAPISP